MNFTDKQKEIVARKLGYDGPMQGFDEFLNSSPSLGMKYSMLSDKFTTRMAKGGAVRKKFVTGGDVTGGVSRVEAEQLVRDRFATIGRTGIGAAANNIDQAGFENWVSSLTTGSVKPQDLNTTFKGSVQDYIAQNPDDMYSRYVTDYMSRDTLASKSTDGSPIAPKSTNYTAEKTATPVAAPVTQVVPSVRAPVTQVGTAATISAPTPVKATTVTASTSQKAVQAALDKQNAVKGTVSDKAQVAAQQGTVSPGALATAQEVDDEFITPVVAGTRTTQADELITAQTDIPVVTAQAEQAAAPENVVAATGTVQANELVTPAQIAESDMAQAQAITADGLAPDATVVAARLDKFTVDDGTLAVAVQGDVGALSTVQGQLVQLMNSFNDGATPAWAAGALRAANAAMSARGLGGSSMAGTAIFQAAMESALPIAAQDAQTYANMGLTNLNNRQQTALANAAAQQGLSLANLSNEQQARLANATNSFALQSQNLSNMQQTMLANTQIRAALQGQNLSNQQQAAVVNAARYAEQANINLNNIQQAALHNSTMAVNVDISNASNRQQANLANAQIEAARQGKILDNKQQAAVLNATRIAENNNLTFTAAQTAALNNSQLMKDIGIANMSAAQQTVIANAATIATMDIANLNNRQQAAVANAKAFLDMDITNLNNAQQLAIVKTQAITQSIMSDTAAKNAASITNATNKLDASKINATLTLTAQQFNAAEKSKVSLFNANAANELNRFNTEQANQREQFNANMSTQINIVNSKLLAEVSVANTAAVNAANAVNAKNATDLSAAQYAQEMQLYRDKLEMSWKMGESEKDRANNIVTTTISASSAANAAMISADSKNVSLIGEAVLKSTTGQAIIDKGLSWASDFLFGTK